MSEYLSPPGATVDGFEVMRVIEDIGDEMRIRLSLADVIDEPYGWGVFLSDVARAIAKSFSEADAEREIRRGFNSEDRYLRGVEWARYSQGK